MNDRIRRTGDEILRLARRWRLLTIRKIVFLPHILSGAEKRLFLFLAAAALAAGAGLGGHVYVQLTHPAPGIGGAYTEGIIGSPRTINPLYASRDADRDLVRLLFSGLIAYDGAGRIRPDLAERFEISADGKTYTVFLRKNARWHDGAPVTADDVIFTIQRIQNPHYKSPLRANWQGVGAEKINDTTVRFTLRTPYAPFIENLAQGVIPRHLWENVGPDEALLHQLNLRPVGSGPYRFEKFKSNGDGSMVWYRVERNPHFYVPGPYLKKITLMFFASEDEMIASWRKGDIEGFGPVSRINTEHMNRGRVSVLSLATPRIFSIFFNSHKAAALADVRVREAIARALDRDKIAASASGGAIVTDTLMPSVDAPAGDGVSRIAFDRESSRKLLDGAGWRDKGSDGIREKKTAVKKKTENTPLRLTLSTADSPELERAAELIKAMLGDIGIAVDIEKKSFADLESVVIRPRAFDMLLFGTVYGYEPDPFAFWHSSQIKDPGLNIALFSNKKADRALESARRATERALRDAKEREFAAIAARELPAIPLYTQLYLYLIPRDIQGADISRISLPSDRFNDINAWYRKTKRVFF